MKNQEKSQTKFTLKEASKRRTNKAQNQQKEGNNKN